MTRFHPLALCALLPLFATRPAGAEELRAVDGRGAVTLSNRHLEVAFAAKGNMIPASVRLASPRSGNLIDLLIISYLTADSKWWYQDNKRGKEGYRHYTHRIERGPDEVKLIVEHPSDQPGDPHFRFTKTIVLGRDKPFVELDYDFVCVREGELKSGVAVPTVWFAPGLTHLATMARGRTLCLGPSTELRGSVEGRWCAGFDPDTGEGLLVAFLGERPRTLTTGHSRDLGQLHASVPLLQQGGMRKGARVHSRFVLRPFRVKDATEALPKLAADTLAAYGLKALRARRVRGGSRLAFDPHDLSLWAKHRSGVPHPCSTFKPADLANAKANIERFAWAKRYVDGLTRGLEPLLRKDRAYFEHMISATTPCCTLFTMCPACEAFPVHGRYHWSPNDPDKLVCAKCKTVYPNPKYPEDHVYVTKWGGGQKLTAYAGKAWKFKFSLHLSSTFLGNIRARKVSYMSNVARRAGLAYALTDDVRYAELAKAALLRFAQVYPGYLVHTGYNEFADMDPKVAAVRIGNLPEDEVTFPPNKPNRRLYPGYWMAGRATGVGMEGVFLTKVAEAYDLTASAKRADGTPVYTDPEQRAVERDLLIEGTYLLLADPRINNKTASNRRGVGIAGIAVGDPLRVRFGLEGFRHFLDNWFLFDGATSESSCYGYMTLSGIFPMGDALHGYSDPTGFIYRGQRLDRFDVYRDPRYQAVFHAFYHSLLPDLSYPVLADEHCGGGMGTRWAEVMFDRYRDPSYLAVLQRRYNGRVAEHGDEYALFHRPADADVSTPAHVKLRSTFFPGWKVGYLRAGRSGKGHTLVLSASDWGGHHHRDGLSLVYHADGQECLSDLGYLWDMPNKSMTVRTFAHNTVVVDEQDQIAGGRIGRAHLFDDSGWAKVIGASSNAYGQCSEYRRTCVMVDNADAGSYVVDFFRVAGGKLHDYVLHGPNESTSTHVATTPAEGPMYDLREVKRLQTDGPWAAAWAMADGLVFTVHAAPAPAETAYMGTGWGQRSHREAPGATLPYVVRRRAGQPRSAFVTVMEAAGHGNASVKHVRRVPCPNAASAVAVRVDTDSGVDYIVSSPTAEAIDLADGGRTMSCRARLAVLSFGRDGLRRIYMLAGESVAAGDLRVSAASPSASGEVLDLVNAGPDSYLVVAAKDLPDPDLAGQWVVVDDGIATTAYRIERVEAGPQRTKLFTRIRGSGFRIDAADTWRIWRSVSIKRKPSQPPAPR